jgi:hypothetical protein
VLAVRGVHVQGPGAAPPPTAAAGAAAGATCA